MGEYFDSYHRWLGIPPQEQPPTLYRLLGLSPNETDLDVIQSAADQRVAHLRTLQLGQHQAESQRLLNEVASASFVLLDAQRRKAYDAVLHSAAPAFQLENSLPEPERANPAPSPAPASRPVLINSAAPSLPAAVGSLANYKVLEAVAGSTLARTHKVQANDTGRYFFLKFVPPESLDKMEVVKRFDRECEILTKLDHPNLIVGHETFQQGGQRFLVMEYVLGADLATLVKQNGPLQVEQATDYLLQAARGLVQLHANGIYHRNLKPHVLLVDLQGRLRITNLLLAKLGDQSTIPTEELTTMGESMGSYDYMPPEQAVDARKADARSDIYSLGCTLFHLLLGRPPYVAKGPMQKIVAHKQSPVPSLTALREEIPTSLDKVFQRMLAKDPAARYQSVEELIVALQKPATKNSWWKQLMQKLGLR